MIKDINSWLVSNKKFLRSASEKTKVAINKQKTSFSNMLYTELKKIILIFYNFLNFNFKIKSRNIFKVI